MQSEASRSEGKVGFKAYKNYFTAGASWFVIIFLILLNIAAQVNNAIWFLPSEGFLHTPVYTVMAARCSSLRVCSETCCLGGTA